MTGFWSRITGRGQAEQQEVERSQMSASERAFTDEGPLGHTVELEVEGHLGGPDVPDEFAEVDKLLEGPTS